MKIDLNSNARRSVSSDAERNRTAAAKPLHSVMVREASFEAARPATTRSKVSNRSTASAITAVGPIGGADSEPGPGSERSFGLVMAGFFVVVALWPVLRGGEPRLWSIVVAAAVGIVAALRPQLLRSANRLWFRFGMLLHKVISPIVLGVLFFMVVTPVGMIMRATGRDVLALSFDRGAKSYWIDRSRDAPGEMNRQF